MVKFLLDMGARINDQNYFMKTALHAAVQFDDLDTAKLLIDRGAKLDIKDEMQRTPLDIARIKNNDQMIKLLTEKVIEPEPIRADAAANVTKSNIFEDCVICFEKRDEIFAFQPCLHAKACEKCCKRILEASTKDSKCPICECVVSKYQKVYF